MKDPNETLMTLIADLSLALAPPLVIGGNAQTDEDVEGALEETGFLNAIATALRAVGEEEMASFATMEDLRQKLSERRIMTSAGHPPTDIAEE